jgi:hypothetical protein
MHVACRLGRIQSIEACPSAVLKGDRNQRIWGIDFSVDQTCMIHLELVDWLSGRPIPRGLLYPTAAALNVTAARCQIYFPVLDGPKFSMAVDMPEHRRPEGDGFEPALFRVRLDAPHTAMR